MIAFVEGDRFHEWALANGAYKILVTFGNVVEEVKVDRWVETTSV